MIKHIKHHLKHHLKKARPRKVSHAFLYIFGATILAIGFLSLELFFVLESYQKRVENLLNEQNKQIVYYAPLPTNIPTPETIFIKPASGNLLSKTQQGEWGVAKQIDENTWTMKVGEDARMSTTQELFEALNNYRQRHGVGRLSLDANLSKFAQDRAQTFSKLGKLDGHAGFLDYVKDENNIKKLGFWGVGENSSSGYQMLGVHLIEWIYAADKPHNDNQLDPSWTHVGIGISETATDLIFGKSKM